MPCKPLNLLSHSNSHVIATYGNLSLILYGFFEIGGLQTSDFKADVVSCPLFSPFFQNGPLPSWETSRPRLNVSSTETSNLRSDIEVDIEVRSQKEETFDLKKSRKKGGKRGWLSSVRTLVQPQWRPRGMKDSGHECESIVFGVV